MASQGNRGASDDANTGVVAMLFSEEQVERLTHLSRQRLRYWATTGFYKPAQPAEDGGMSLYAFLDLVALRTLELLRVQHGVPLQHLRKVAERLAHLQERRWTGTTLYAINKKVIWHEPGTGLPQEILSGQYLLGIPLKAVMDDTRRDAEKLLERPAEAIGQVGRQRRVLRNTWVLSGTRIPVDAILRLHEDGYSNEQILAEYPDLSLNDVAAALNHARSAA
jgi:DNA-binding transcriptional MerR regulator